MTQAKPGKFWIEMKWALICTAMYLVWMGIERLAGFHDTRLAQQPFVTSLILIPSVAIYALALLDKRRNFFGEQMSYRQGALSGCVLTVFVVILSPLGQLLTSLVVTPRYFANAIEYTVANGVFDRVQAEQQFNLGNYIVTSIVGGLMTGLLFSVVVPLFTRSRATPVQQSSVGKAG